MIVSILGFDKKKVSKFNLLTNWLRLKILAERVNPSL